MMSRTAWLALFLVMMLPGGGSAAIPLEAFFGDPACASPQISADATHVAWLAPYEGVMNVWVRTFGRSDDHAITRERGRGISRFRFSTEGERILYLLDREGDGNTHLYSVKLAAPGETVDLTPYPGARADIVAIDPGYARDIFVAINDRAPAVQDVYRINLENGQRALEIQNDEGAIAWVVDHRLVVRAAVVPQPDGGMVLRHRDAAGAPWTDLARWGAVEALTTRPVGFSYDNRNIYLLTSDGSGTTELRSIDVGTGGEKRLARDPVSDVAAVLLHPTRHTLNAVAFARDRMSWRPLDAACRPDFELLAKAAPGDIHVESRDDADRRWIVKYTGDAGPVRWFLHERMAKTTQPLFVERPALEGASLGAVRPVSFPGPDSLTLNGFLTLPHGREAGKLPAVLLVHDGPWSRDRYGFDPVAQWLADRGYAVLQVNYRGSTGYGKALLAAGDREWGGAIQDDLARGAAWLVSQGIADAKRIGIMGRGFGGFAAMSALAATPEVFACAVSYGAPVDLAAWIATAPEVGMPPWDASEVSAGRFTRSVLARHAGDPAKDAAMLASRSPVARADRIRKPLLFARGGADRRVTREDCVRLKEALASAGTPVEFIEYAGEGGTIDRAENRIAFHGAAEAFLARHLGGGAGN